MDSDSTIFVSIACFMDPDVINTVKSLFEKADNPQRIRVGICLQYDSNIHSFTELDDLPRVALVRLPYSQARGPIYARYRCEQLLSDEDFFFQIDCHSRFFDHWDTTLLAEYDKCSHLSQNVVISHYPINIRNMEDSAKLAMIGHINRFRHIGPDAIKLHGSLVKLGKDPKAGFGISAAMLFMKSDTKKTIKYDPRLHYGLHAAEQFLYSARLWTHGYDFYSPTAHTVATEYVDNRSRIPKHVRSSYNRESGIWAEKTWSKVKYCLGLEPLEKVDAAYRSTVTEDKALYDMGDQRELIEYFEFIGLHGELLQHFPYYKRHHGD